MVQTFIEGIVFGFLAHQTRGFIDPLPRGWREWVAYVIGVVAAYVIAARLHTDSGGGIRAFSVSYFTAFAAVGTGVGIGWVVDTITERVSE